jgi:glucose-1-phosphate cytidylyltransferase
MAFRHEGFWQRVDTFDDKERLESLWASGNAPWNLKPMSDVTPQKFAV